MALDLVGNLLVLSAIAGDITGTRWNGFRFFGLRETPRNNQ
jgi:hypothetical protein